MPKLRPLVPILLLTLLPWPSTTRAEDDCNQLTLRWRSGNYGLKASTGWPRRPDGETLALFEIDPMLAGLRRQVLGIYSQYHSGTFVVDIRGGMLLSDLLQQLSALEGLYVEKPSPRLEQQIRALRQDLKHGPAQLETEIGPLRQRYQELQGLANKARSSMRERLQQVCGNVPREGFELTNWEDLPAPPPLRVPSPPAGLELGPEQPLQTPVPVDPAADNPLWAEVEGKPRKTPQAATDALPVASTDPDPLAADSLPETPEAAAAALADVPATLDPFSAVANPDPDSRPTNVPAGSDPLAALDNSGPDSLAGQTDPGSEAVPDAFEALSAPPSESGDPLTSLIPEATPVVGRPDPRKGPTPTPTYRSVLPDRQRQAFLDSLAVPDEESDAEPAQTDGPKPAGTRPPDAAWALFVETGATSTTPTPVLDEEALPIDPDAEPVFQESTLSNPDETLPLTPVAETESTGLVGRPASALGGPIGKMLLGDSFNGGLGPERLGGTWTIQNGSLRVLGTNVGDSSYVLSREAWVNYQVEVDFQFDSGRNEAGLLLRAQRGETKDGQVVHSQDFEPDGYVLRIRANTSSELSFHDSLDLAVRQKGKTEKIVCGVNTDIRPLHMHKLLVRMDFSRIEIDLNGKRVLSCNDDTFAAGGLMLRVVGDTAARFDDVMVREVPIAGSDAPIPRRGIKVSLPGESLQGWTRLGGRFVPLSGMLYGEGSVNGPALTQRSLKGLLEEAGAASDSLRLEVDLRSVGQHGGGGLLLSLGSGRLYAVVLTPGDTPGEGRVQLLRQNREGWEAMARHELPLDLAVWHRIALIVEPGSLAIQVDGNPALRGRASMPGLEAIGVYVDPEARILADRMTLSTPN